MCAESAYDMSFVRMHGSGGAPQCTHACVVNVANRHEHRNVFVKPIQNVVRKLGWLLRIAAEVG